MIWGNMRRLGKKSKNASKWTKRWSDHDVEQLIDLLEENSFLWNVSNKDYYLRKKRERAYKQMEKKLGTERAVIKAKIITLRQQYLQLSRSFASTNKWQQLPTLLSPTMSWLMRPFAWAFRQRYSSTARVTLKPTYHRKTHKMILLLVAVALQNRLCKRELAHCLWPSVFPSWSTKSFSFRILHIVCYRSEVCTIWILITWLLVAREQGYYVLSLWLIKVKFVTDSKNIIFRRPEPINRKINRISIFLTRLWHLTDAVKPRVQKPVRLKFSI